MIFEQLKLYKNVAMNNQQFSKLIFLQMLIIILYYFIFLENMISDFRQLPKIKEYLNHFFSIDEK